MKKSFLGFVSAIFTCVWSQAFELHAGIQNSAFPTRLRILWEGQEYTTNDPSEIKEILHSDLINDPKLVIKESEVQSVNPTTICVVKE